MFTAVLKKLWLMKEDHESSEKYDPQQRFSLHGETGAVPGFYFLFTFKINVHHITNRHAAVLHRVSAPSVHSIAC